MSAQIITKVQKVLENISTKVSKFVDTTGLNCPPNCGACCHSPSVEAMPIEVLPLAKFAIGNDIQPSNAKPCVFFMAGVGKTGRCGAYEYRPSICRIFPYGTTKDKHANIRWSPCVNMTDREAIQKARKAIEGGQAVSYVEARSVLADINPSMSQTMPINQAVIQAMEYLKLKSCYANTGNTE